MPFLADDSEDNRKIVPAHADDSVDYQCPQCSGKMRVRPLRSTDSDIIRHFFHSDRSSECAGESDEHKIAKAAMVSILWQIVPEVVDYDNIVTIEEELTLTANQDGRRKSADVGCVFTESMKPWGRGLLVEIQHKNNSKDLLKTTVNYLNRGYSVLWLKSSRLVGQTELSISEFKQLIIGKHYDIDRDIEGELPIYIAHDQQRLHQKMKNQLNLSENEDILQSDPGRSDAYREKRRKLHETNRRRARRYTSNKYRNSKGERVHECQITYKGLLYCDIEGCQRKPWHSHREHRDGATVYFRRCDEHQEITQEQIDYRFSL